MKKINTEAFSIVIAMGLTLIMVLLVLFILEYMIPYSKNVKGIENSTSAFYQAESAIEDGLYFFSSSGRTTLVTETSSSFGSSPLDFEYQTYSSGSAIPYNGEGNSSFSGELNIISPGNPIQLDISNGLAIDWSASEIYFKVPDLDEGGGEDETLSGSTTAIINWQLSSDNNSLNATGSWINEGEICTGNGGCTGISMETKQGQDLNGNETNDERFKDYYDDHCGSGSGCSLKFSVINKLETTNGVPIPYLEYWIDFAGVTVPLRYSRIKSSGKSYGFQKSLEVKVPQQTTNEAFDFTVFQ